MNTELHNYCNFTSQILQNSCSDFVKLPHYSRGMETKQLSGRRLKAARKANGLRLEDVCARVPGLTVSRLSNWEQGRNMIGVDEARKIAPVLGVTASHLLALDEVLYPDATQEVLKAMSVMEPDQQYRVLAVVKAMTAPSVQGTPAESDIKSSAREPIPGEYPRIAKKITNKQTG